MSAYTYERTCAVRYGPSSLMEEAQRDIAKSVPCTDPGVVGGFIDLYLIDVGQVHYHIPVCTAEAVAGMRMAAGTRCH